MKKPTIELLHMDMPTNKLVVNGGNVDVDEAYEEMINALMKLYKYAVENKPNFLLTEKYIKISEIERALTKAGVEL